MTTVRPAPAHPPSPPLGVLAGLAVVILAALVSAVPVASAYSAPIGGPQYEPSSWTNGVVLCDFNTTVPAVTTSALGVPGWGMWMGIQALSQLTLAGLLAEDASIAGATWVATNVSTAGSLAIVYTANVSVHTVVGLPVGTAKVSVLFSLATFAGAPTNGSYRVAASLTVANWPWLPLAGALVASFSVAPAAVGVDRLVSGGAAGATVASVSNSTGGTLAYVSAATEANATNSTSGLTSLVPVLTSLLGLTPQTGTLSVSFGSGAAGASAVGYDAAMVVVPPASVLSSPGPLGLPIGDYLAAGGAAVVISLAIAGGARRARRSPSDLEYVEEEA